MTARRDDVSAEVAELVARLLEKAPADRYATGARSCQRSERRRRPARAPSRRVRSRRPDREIDRRAAVHEHERRRGQRVLQRRPHRGDHHRLVGREGAARHLAQLVHAAQGQPRRRRGRSGEHSGVRYLLTGSVRKAGNALRIATQLVDAENDAPLWAEKYSGTMDDIFDVQERVSRAIVAALEVTLTVIGRRQARRATNPERACVRAVPAGARRDAALRNVARSCGECCSSAPSRSKASRHRSARSVRSWSSRGSAAEPPVISDRSTRRRRRRARSSIWFPMPRTAMRCSGSSTTSAGS